MPVAFDAVRTFKPMDQKQIAAVLARSKDAAMTGKYKLFKTANRFDATAQHPDWLG
jgi:hypothetical protein